MNEETVAVAANTSCGQRLRRIGQQYDDAIRRTTLDAIAQFDAQVESAIQSERDRTSTLQTVNLELAAACAALRTKVGELQSELAEMTRVSILKNVTDQLARAKRRIVELESQHRQHGFQTFATNYVVDQRRNAAATAFGEDIRLANAFQLGTLLSTNTRAFETHLDECRPSFRPPKPSSPNAVTRKTGDNVLDNATNDATAHEATAHEATAHEATAHEAATAHETTETTTEATESTATAHEATAHEATAHEATAHEATAHEATTEATTETTTETTTEATETTATAHETTDAIETTAHETIATAHDATDAIETTAHETTATAHDATDAAETTAHEATAREATEATDSTTNDVTAHEAIDATTTNKAIANDDDDGNGAKTDADGKLDSVASTTNDVSATTFKVKQLKRRNVDREKRSYLLGSDNIIYEYIDDDTPGDAVGQRSLTTNRVSWYPVNK